MIRNGLSLLLCGFVAGLLAWAGHTLLFHVFMLYDDEGYVLISLKNFSLHGSLYDRVYSQYGPAFYLIYDTLHRLFGFAWTNTSGRWITLCNWIGTTLFCTLLVRRAGGSWPLVLCVLVEVFSFLRIMASEPMHPGSTITLIVAAAAWLGWELLQAGRITGFASVTAGLGAVLTLIKINVGVFLLLSSVFWLTLGIPAARTHRRNVMLIGLGGLLPLLLMRSRIHFRRRRRGFNRICRGSRRTGGTAPANRSTCLAAFFWNRPDGHGRNRLPDAAPGNEPGGTLAGRGSRPAQASRSLRFRTGLAAGLTDVGGHGVRVGFVRIAPP